MMAATDYPFLEVMATMVIFFFWVAWIWMLAHILVDVFRRDDIGGWKKAGWCAFVIFLPFLGVLSYLISQNDRMAGRASATYYGAPVAVNGHGESDGPAAEIAQGHRLLESGTITDAEFAQLKRRVLA